MRDAPTDLRGARATVWRAIVLGAFATFLSGTVAFAGCLHTNQLWSCVDASGNPTQLYCIGVGSVLSCDDFAGNWLQVSPHEVLSSITDDSQVSAALEAVPTQSTETLTVGTNGISTTTKSAPKR